MMKLLIYMMVFFVVFFTFLSCEEVLIEEDLSDKTIVIIAPVDSTAVRNTSVTFSWEEVGQATSYRLQVAQPSFENASQIVLDTSVTATNFNTNLIRNEYQWRVRAQNSGSATPYVTAGFTIIENEDFSAIEVILESPVDNEITNMDTGIELKWQFVTDATLYRVQLLDNSNQVIQEETTTETTVSLLFPEGVSKWQVRAENNTQSTLYTTRTLTIDSKAPNKPIPTAPVNNTTQTETTATFSWTREVVEGATEFDSIYIYEDEQLTQLVTKDQVISPSEISLDASTTYYWFLRAFDRADNKSDSSDVSSFTIN